MHTIKKIQQSLLDYYGPLHWWPGETPFEIAVGAILTQNTNWKNVEKAIHNLISEDLLSEKGLYSVSQEYLGELIKPSGYFNQKARKLKIFSKFLIQHYQGEICNFLESASLSTLRKQLLAIWGIGPETADSILLYAGNKEIFVIDAYTRRIFSRHNLCDETADYETLRSLVENTIEKSVRGYNEFHAGLVLVAKDFCKKTNPDCSSCPINYLLQK